MFSSFRHVSIYADVELGECLPEETPSLVSDARVPAWCKTCGCRDLTSGIMSGGPPRPRTDKAVDSFKHEYLAMVRDVLSDGASSGGIVFLVKHTSTAYDPPTGKESIFSGLCKQLWRVSGPVVIVVIIILSNLLKFLGRWASFKAVSGRLSYWHGQLAQKERTDVQVKKGPLDQLALGLSALVAHAEGRGPRGQLVLDHPVHPDVQGKRVPWDHLVMGCSDPLARPDLLE
ncbi:hypothetical protein Bbelb_202550 [Branchiostoma belcheri]|nr:hypothetical protein Bbelb_202550 [Branchiostoma belcheri]